jgi:hypothetical protein
MPWFKVDDGAWSSPKFMRASAPALALWLRAGSWSAQQLTDGAIALQFLPVFGGTLEAAEELVELGLWERHGPDFVFHDWHEYQPSRAVVLAERAAARTRMANSRAAKHLKDASEQGANVRANNAGTFDDGSPDVQAPRPSQPVPPVHDSSSKSKGAAKRGSRIDSRFEITDELRAWARSETPLVNVDAALPEFVDYWASVPGDRGVKLDWVATWRNSMRKKQEFAIRDGVSAPKRGADDWMDRNSRTEATP